jgi:ubiquinone/menaquinone biosynthesis C-methylase UbiE
MISLDVPQVLLGESGSFIIIKGWCNAACMPNWVQVKVGDVVVPVSIKPAPHVDKVYPNMQAVAYEAQVDLTEVYCNPNANYSSDLFAVVINIDCGTERRGFELPVTQAWVDKTFGGVVPSPRAKPPVPNHLMIRVCGSADRSFFPSGHVALGQIRELLLGEDVRIKDMESILDFGAGCGRVIVALHNEGISAKLHASDIDKEAIAWCQQNLSSAATFDWNESLPPTRYAANTFDLVYAISVFTHLPEDYQFAWLAEMNRIIKPGGVLLTTVHGPTCTRQLPQEGQSITGSLGFFYINETPKGWASHFGHKTEGLPDFYRITYHSFDYVRKHWSEYFDILDIKEQGLNNPQDAVICRKRCSR